MKHTECEDCKLREGDCGHHFKMDGTTNYDIASLSACDQYGNCMFFKSKVKPNGDLISRSELIKALEPYKFSICGFEGVLALIDNAPTVTPTFGLFKEMLCSECEKRPQGECGKWVISEIQCPNCFEYFETDCYSTEELKKCPNCGAEMKND